MFLLRSICQQKKNNNLPFSKCSTFIRKKRLSHKTTNTYMDRYGTLSAGIPCCTRFHVCRHAVTRTEGVKRVTGHMFSSRCGLKTVHNKKAVSTTDCNTVNADREIAWAVWGVAGWVGEGAGCPGEASSLIKGRPDPKLWRQSNGGDGVLAEGGLTGHVRGRRPETIPEAPPHSHPHPDALDDLEYG